MLGAFLVAFSQSTWSLGLGEAMVESFLGQPLEVKIELITRPTDDLASINASLASAADYQLIGASRDDISVPLQFLVRDLDGNAHIAVSSKLAINSPVVRLILEVNWSSGRMLREYTLFLDPPTYSQPAPAPRIEPERTTEVQAPQPTPEPVSASTSTATSTSTTVDDAAIFGTDEYGPVQSGDTLWRIATDWSAESGLNVNKVMLAIQRQNPQAFSRNNINLLQRGAILRMPQRDEINSISSATASSEVSRQIDAFQSRRSISMASAAVPLVAEESAAIEPVVDVQIEEEPLSDPLIEDQPLPSEVPTDLASDQLELLPPSEINSLDSAYGVEESEAATDDAISAQALREELSRKEEELINQQQENAYLQQRLEELEGQLAQSREGAVEDENLANMEERLRQERLAESQTPVPKVVSAPKPGEPWYSRYLFWLLSLLILLAVLAGWIVSRRGRSDTVVSDLGRAPDTPTGSEDEAEDDLPIQESGSEDKVADEEATQEMKAELTEASATGEDEDTATMPARDKLADEDEDARVLDEESADPEIQLDLARAYISMGDKQAARVILEEVLVHGSEEQLAEANKMKDML